MGSGGLPAWVALAAVVGYALGSLSPATVVARRLRADVRGAGSGNPGATNVGRLLGVRYGVAVALIDVLKGLAPAAAFVAVAGEVPGLVAGAAAVLGHVTSPLLRGHGGRGVATSLGAVLGVHPLWGAAALAVFAVVVAAGRWVALASVSAAASLPVIAHAAGGSDAATAWAYLLAAVVLVRHRANLARRWRASRRRASP